jgi:hypothetical protein
LAGNVVCDYWDRLEIGACAVHAAPVCFGNVRSLLGVTVSGEYTPGGGTVMLTAWKDCTLTVNELSLSLKKAESRTLLVG